MAGQGPNTSALQCRHTSQKTSAVSKRLGGLPTVPEVKEGSNRVQTTASDTTINGVFTVRDMPHANEVLSSPCMDSRKQEPRLTRSKSAMVVPGLVIGLSASTGDNGPTPTEPLSADKPSGLRKPSPKLGFFETVCVPVYKPFCVGLLVAISYTPDEEPTLQKRHPYQLVL
jgi:hypothetical protein